MPDTAVKRIVAMFAGIAAAMERERDHLSALDGAIGDADHGMTMSLGFRAVGMALATPGSAATPSDVFRVAAGAFLDAVGASTGPLYATGFLRAAGRLEGCSRFDLAAQVAMLEGIASGIAERGKGARGEKTMLDAWLPAAEAAQQAAGHTAPAEFWTLVRQAAARGAEATRPMIARRGRAARLGERSVGHVDPGARSAALIVEAMGEVLARSEPPEAR